MERKIINRLVIFILILAGVILSDLLLPHEVSGVKDLESIYSSTVITGGGNKPTMQTRAILLLSSGELYPIGKSPDVDYAKGTKIRIAQSMIFNNVNKIFTYENGWKENGVGLFSNIIILIAFAMAIFISALNLFINNRILNIALVAATMFMAVISMVYMFYY